MRTGGKQMQKLKYVFVVLVTAAMIAFCAVLPMITAHFQDFSADGKVVYRDMAELELNIRELTIYEKLYLLRYAQSLEVDEGKALLSQEEVRAAVEKGLQPYADAGFITTDMDSLSFECSPMLFYDVINSEEMTGMFWNVTMNTYYNYGYSKEEMFELSADMPETYISLVLDDDTGKIMQIQIITEQEDFYVYDEMRLWELCEIYFDNLGLDEEATVSFMENPEFFLAEPETLCMIYSIGDIFYGELDIAFYFFEGGFYNSIY